MENFISMIEPRIQYILDLGPAVMLPLVIIIFALCLGLKIGKAFNAGLMIGIGFIGIGIVITLMRDTLGPAAEQMAKNFGLNLTVIDLGWPGTSPMTWASKIALVAIPVAILVNLIMLALKMTRVVNVDIWNIWHMTFTGALVHIVTGNYWLGILGVVVHAVFSYKFGDWFQYDTRDYFGLEGIAVPHGTSAYCAPFAVIVDAILDKIPGINKIDIDTEKLEKKLLSESLQDADREEGIKKLAEMEQKFRQKQSELAEDYNLRRNEEFAALQQNANRAIVTLAKRDGYDLILQDAIYVNSKFDITDEVLREINK